MSSVPDVSVSLVNTNSRELLLACLESLRGSDVEVVVLDNASEDGSAPAVRERFPGVRVIEQRHRAGFGANHNTVIRATTGRYVFVLNEDKDKVLSDARSGVKSPDPLAIRSNVGDCVAITLTNEMDPAQ